MRVSFVEVAVRRRLVVVAVVVLLLAACGSDVRETGDVGSGSAAFTTAPSGPHAGDLPKLVRLLLCGQVDYTGPAPATTAALADAADVIVQGTIDHFIEGPSFAAPREMYSAGFVEQTRAMWVNVTEQIKGTTPTRIAVLAGCDAPVADLDAAAPTDRPVLLYLVHATTPGVSGWSATPSNDPDFDPTDVYSTTGGVGWFVQYGRGVGDIAADHWYDNRDLSAFRPSDQPITRSWAADPASFANATLTGVS